LARRKRRAMLYLLWAVAGVLVFLWLLAVGGALVTSGWIHVLLLGAILAIVATLFTPPRTV
jgi:lipopolysaccharide export LptBFGC system permease protein LptF